MTSHPVNPMASMPGQVPFGFPGMGMNPMQGGAFPFSMMPLNMNRGPLTPPLYVGDLDETIHDEYLHDFFSKYGPLHFVRIMRDGATGKSRGFAYVNFINPRDAETARQHAQYEKMGRKHIRIMFKRNMRELPSNANLFVKNIDKNANIKDLDNFFTKDGTNIVCCKLATNSEGQSLGYGYVQFEKPEEANAALQAHDNQKLKEQEVHISVFIPKEKRPDNTARRNIYLKNLPSNLSEEELGKLVEKTLNQYGPIETKMIKRHATENKFFAFVCFKDEEAAHKAFEELQKNPQPAGFNEPLYVNWHQNRTQRARELKNAYQQVRNETNLFVKNLKLTTSDNDLKTAFSSFGSVISVATKDWVKNGQTQAKCGFIAFGNGADAQRCLSEALHTPEVRELFLPNNDPFISMHQSQESRRSYLAGLRRWKHQKQLQQPQVPQGRMFPPQHVMPMNPNFFKVPMHRGGRPGGRPGAPGGWGKGPQGPQHRGPQGGPRGNFNRPQGGPQDQMGRPQQGGRPGGAGQAHIQGPNQGQAHPQGAPSNNAGITVQNLRAKQNEFLQLDQDKQRQILGELLFPRVRELSTDVMAPKITGMLVDLTVLEVSEILDFLEDQTLLAERVSEALELIQQENL